MADDSLLAAAREGNLEEVARLLDAGSDVNEMKVHSHSHISTHIHTHTFTRLYEPQDEDLFLFRK